MKRSLLFTFTCLWYSITFCQDLVVADVIGPKTHARYQSFLPSIVIKNQGIVDIEKTYIVHYVYFSLDDKIDATDKQLDVLFSGKLAAGEIETLTASDFRNIDVAPGNYYLIIDLDVQSTVTETDEENNIFIEPGYVVTASDVDWEGIELKAFNSFITSRAQVQLSFKNNGSKDVGGELYVSVYLSSDSVFDASDILTTKYSEEIELGGPDVFEGIFINSAIPKVDLGEYYFIARLDYEDWRKESQFEETNESNNIIFSQRILLEQMEADLTITYAEFNSITSNDVSLFGSAIIENDGITLPAAIGPVEAKLFLSSDMTLDAADLDLGYYTPDYIDAFVYNTGFIPLNGMLPTQLAPGEYFIIIEIDPFQQIIETDESNNLFAAPLTVEEPPVLAILLSDGSFIGSYDNTDTEYKLSLKFTNTGIGFNSDFQNYELKIKNQNGDVMFTAVRGESFYLQSGDNKTSIWDLLIDPLPIGNYTVEISCQSSSDCYTNDYSLNLSVDQVVYALTGNIQGEDGTHITKGKLFLYQKGDDGKVKFINKVAPTNGSAYSFSIDNHQHTLYFIPDPVLFPQYVPTILGKTMVLKESSFITLTSDTEKLFEILKLKPLGSGSMSIVGNVSTEGSSPNGRVRAFTLTLSEPVPVILLSAAGEPIAVTTTDAQGNYEFKNLPSGIYQIIVPLELDKVTMEEPIPVDVTQHSARLDFVLGTQAVTPTLTKLQKITFNTLPQKQFAQPAFSLAATSTSGLPVTYTSSDPAVATVSGNTVTINGAGSSIITALQSGNSSFSPANPVPQTLIVNKANQTISFGSLQERTLGDADFSLNASASSGLDVSYSSSNINVAAVSGNKVIIKGAGTAVITATQSGNGNYNAAFPIKQTFNVREPKKSQEITFTALPSKSYKDPVFTLTAKSTSGLTISYNSSNTDVATVSGNKVTIKTPGVTVIKAMQPGNSTFLAALPVEQTLVVDKALQSVIFGGFPQNVSIETKSFVLGGYSTAELQVSYSSSNTSVATVTSNVVSIIGPGSVRITAMQSGNNYYKEAVPVFKDLYVSRLSQTISFAGFSEKSVNDPDFTLEATSSSGLPITYESSDHKVAVVNGNKVSIVGAGTTVITAHQVGSETYEPVSVKQELIVNLVTGLEEMNNRQMILSPNPVSSELRIDFSTSTSGPADVVVYDTYGRVALRSKVLAESHFKLDVSQLVGGVYSVSVIQGGKTFSRRIIKN
jgi:hypothetical protein